ncbi:uncharacterized protein LOC132759479 [Ruditapes philippinarum]|uniref:uncharacterized protein LOC132759479 n=1 Tax=Ruditapes philippinarum TaxID=129788 RepID=UPI00295A8C07|nr:uncharacterized protein LOC132759479 [Ruditapes philippinarum]
MAFKNIFQFYRRRHYLNCFIVTGVILSFIIWKNIYSKEHAMSHKVKKYDSKRTNRSIDEIQNNYFGDIKFQLNSSSSRKMALLNTVKRRQKDPLVKIENQEKRKNLTQNIASPSISKVLDIYNISKQEYIDQNICAKTKTPGRFFICTYTDTEDVVSGVIQRSGRWEEAITQRILSVLNQKQNQPITFIDVGANIGFFSLLAASSGQPVVAIEPWYRHVQTLSTSIQLNKFQKRIQLIQNAVSNERGEVQLNIGVHGNLGGARLISERERVYFKETMTVKKILLNDIAALINTPYVVIKLDIEGHECRALERSEDILFLTSSPFSSLAWNGELCKGRRISQVLPVQKQISKKWLTC